MIPIVSDVNQELEALQKQKQENMALYNFGGNTHSEEEEE
jgi:hypothetical protein